MTDGKPGFFLDGFPVPSTRRGIEAEHGSVTELRRQRLQFREDERERRNIQGRVPERRGLGIEKIPKICTKNTMGLYFNKNFCMHRLKLHEAGQREQGKSEVLTSHTKTISRDLGKVTSKYWG